MSSQAATPARMPPIRIYHDFLAIEDNRALLACAIAEEESFGPSLLVGDVRNVDRWTAVSLPKTAGTAWNEKLAARIDALAPKFFADIGITPFPIVQELKMVGYNDGDRFKPHIDVHTGAVRHAKRDRVLSGVYYFHREPKGFSGGALRIHAFGPEGNDAFVDIQPEQNSFVLFPSWARHEVREVACPSGEFADSRFAVNCWLCRSRVAAS